MLYTLSLLCRNQLFKSDVMKKSPDYPISSKPNRNRNLYKLGGRLENPPFEIYFPICCYVADHRQRNVQIHFNVMRFQVYLTSGEWIMYFRSSFPRSRRKPPTELHINCHLNVKNYFSILGNPFTSAWNVCLQVCEVCCLCLIN